MGCLVSKIIQLNKMASLEAMRRNRERGHGSASTLQPSSFTPQFSRAPLQSRGSECFLLVTKQGDAAAAPHALHTPRLTEFKGHGSISRYPDLSGCFLLSGDSFTLLCRLTHISPPSLSCCHWAKEPDWSVLRFNNLGREECIKYFYSFGIGN